MEQADREMVRMVGEENMGKPGTAVVSIMSALEQ